MTINIATAGKYRINYWTIDWDETDMITSLDVNSIDEVKEFVVKNRRYVDAIYDDEGNEIKS